MPDSVKDVYEQREKLLERVIDSQERRIRTLEARTAGFLVFIESNGLLAELEAFKDRITKDQKDESDE